MTAGDRRGLNDPLPINFFLKTAGATTLADCFPLFLSHLLCALGIAACATNTTAPFMFNRATTIGTGSTIVGMRG